MDASDFLVDGPTDAALTLILAHGAGGPMRSAFMARIARGIGERGFRVARFEFPYMREKRRVPDREPVLRETWLAAIEALGGGGRLAVAGKSMGGRIASMVADDAGARGLLCLGYPFHPPGRPEKLRTKHLETLATPALIVQGTRDPFGGRGEVEGYGLSKSIRIAWIEDGDHSFKPRSSSGRTEAENLKEAIALAANFLEELAR